MPVFVFAPRGLLLAEGFGELEGAVVFAGFGATVGAGFAVLFVAGCVVVVVVVVVVTRVPVGGAPVVPGVVVPVGAIVFGAGAVNGSPGSGKGLDWALAINSLSPASES